MFRGLNVCLVIWLGLFCCTRLAAAESEGAGDQAVIGQPVTDFTLNDFRGREHTLSEYADKKIVVLLFLGTECPLVKLYAPRLADLANEFDAQGVQFLGINSNRQDAITEIANYARIHELPFPILKDVGNRLADRVEAARTPEVFVLDSERKIRYRGRIDDQYGVGYIRDQPRQQELRDAVEALLNDQPVPVAKTEAVGCLIGRVKSVDDHSPVTYSGDVARILQQNCVECHREGEIAPFALTSYDEVAGWADMIAEVVRDRRMPPWHANPHYGSFSNDRSLSETDKQLLYRWAAAGAPQGNPDEAPEAPTFASGWQLPRKPDLVVEMPETFVVPAEAGEEGVRYQYFTVDPGFTEDRWVTMAEAQPGNRAVVHHILMFLKLPDGESGTPGAYFTPYVPGLRMPEYPPGMAKRIPAGSKIVFQVHYTPIGREQSDRSRIGFLFAKPEEVTHRVVTVETRNSKLKIPPHEADHVADATSQALDFDVQLLSFLPHMHLRGKAFRYEARFPDGQSEILLDIPEYDFNWQTIYRLNKPRVLPAGTRMHCIAHFDNSERNPWNPDPSATVRWGEQTWDEMLIGYFDIAIPVEPRTSASGENATPRAGNILLAAQAKALFAKLDANQDGGIDQDETPPKHRKHFDRLDADESGKISEDELREGLSKLLR